MANANNDFKTQNICNLSKNIDVLAKHLNLFITIFFKDIEKDNWRLKIQNKDNELIKYLKQNKNNLVSTVNKLNYIDSNNYSDENIMLQDIENQKKLKKEFKKLLNTEENLDIFFDDLFFKAKQNLLFKYVLNDYKDHRFSKNIQYNYMLEKYIYVEKYKKNLFKIYEKIIKGISSCDYVILDDDFNLTLFTQIFIHNDLFNEIKKDTLQVEKKQEILELLLDIKNKLISRVRLYILHINMMFKHKIISNNDLLIFLEIIKKNILKGFLKKQNIIIAENTSIWCYYFIMNYYLYKDNKDYKFIFDLEFISQIYLKYKYLEFI